MSTISLYDLRVIWLTLPVCLRMIHAISASLVLKRIMKAI